MDLENCTLHDCKTIKTASVSTDDKLDAIKIALEESGINAVIHEIAMEMGVNVK